MRVPLVALTCILAFVGPAGLAAALPPPLDDGEASVEELVVMATKMAGNQCVGVEGGPHIGTGDCGSPAPIRLCVECLAGPIPDQVCDDACAEHALPNEICVYCAGKPVTIWW